MSHTTQASGEDHRALMAALADAHRAVNEARSLAAQRAVASNTVLVEFEALFEEYEAAYERYRNAILRVTELSESEL